MENEEIKEELEETPIEGDTKAVEEDQVQDENTEPDTDSKEKTAEAGEEAPEDAGEDDTNEDTIDDKKNKFFKRKKDKRDERIEELSDKVKRQMAEFENFRKRSEKEKAGMYDMGARSMLEKILPVVDNFERGLDGIDEDAKDPFADGMRMVYKQLVTALSDAGVAEIEAIGKEFDPELHNAVMHIDDEDYGENEIVEVMQKGYTYHDSVVRFAMVKVAN